ncbi:MAG TPA: hypothetical protein VI233_05060, partial [Puia sp.]
MSLAIYEHQTPVKLSQLLPVSILFVLTMIEWVSWTPATSFLRTVFSSLEVTASFWIAIGLLVISLIALACSATIRNLVSHSMYLMLADTAVVGWSPLRKTVVDLLPATFLSIVATILLFQAVPAAVRDISTVPHTVSLVYVLAIAVIFLLMAKVPRLVKVALDKRVRFIGRYECYCVLDASGLLAYVYDESSNRWNRRPEADLVVKGQQVALFDPTVQFTDHIKIASPTLEAGIDLTILATRDSFPGQITNEDITKIRHWVSAEASERKKLMEVAAGKLSSSFDKQTKAMFGISEQGQFIFDNVAKIIKGNTLKAWDMIAQIDCTAIARQLEHNFSAALFGRKAASLPIVYSVDVSVRSLDL